MTGSRQQRRARERAERKAGTRPGPNPAPSPPPPPARRPAAMEVELSRLDATEEDPVWWHAEWGIKDDSVGIEDSSDDLAQLVRDIIEDMDRWSPRYEIRSIEWSLTGDEPPTGTIADEIAALSVTLPDRLPHQ